MSQLREPVEGWDRTTQQAWDNWTPSTKAKVLEEYALRIQDPGNTRAHLLAAAQTIRELGAMEPLASPWKNVTVDGIEPIDVMKPFREAVNRIYEQAEAAGYDVVGINFDPPLDKLPREPLTTLTLRPILVRKGLKQKWLITVGGYGSFEFDGTEAEAEEMRAHKSRWEGGVGHKHPFGNGQDGHCDACRPRTVAPSG